MLMSASQDWQCSRFRVVGVRILFGSWRFRVKGLGFRALGFGGLGFLWFRVFKTVVVWFGVRSRVLGLRGLRFQGAAGFLLKRNSSRRETRVFKVKAP